MNDLRKIDDQIIESIKEIDFNLNISINTIVKNHPTFVMDFFINDIFQNSIGSGGVRIFSGSRKKEQIKYKMFDLISCVDNPMLFTNNMVKWGLIRGVKELFVIDFFGKIKENGYLFFKKYGDPFDTYKSLYAYHYTHEKIKKIIVETTFDSLSKIVLNKYDGWESIRSIKSDIDKSHYEEDVQNSLFSINKAFSLFNTKKHKSFFSYVTQWIKNGIKNSSFIIDDRKKKIEDETGKIIFLSFVGEEEAEEFMQQNSCIPTPEDLLIEREDTEESTVLSFLTGSMPIPNELRVLYYLLKKNVKV